MLPSPPCRLRPPRPGVLKACALCAALLAGCLLLRLLAAPGGGGSFFWSASEDDSDSGGSGGGGLRSRLLAFARSSRTDGGGRGGGSGGASASAAEQRTFYTLNDEHLDLHFGVVIDCGSSGSRLFVYAWPTHSGNEHQLLNIRPLAAPNGKRIVKKVNPGISDFAANPSAAFDYLTPLLDFASSAVPKAKLVETPLYILCTAGMRLLPQDRRDAILAGVRAGVKRSYSFLFSDSHAEVISGKQEGVYAWITTNFLLGRFGHSVGDGVGLVSYGDDSGGRHRHLRKRTVGVIDMGGGSFQVAYEISPEAAAAMPESRDAVAEFNLGCRQSDTRHLHTLYVATFLGFGANAARQRYEDALVAEAAAAAAAAAAATTAATTTTAAAVNRSAAAVTAVSSNATLTAPAPLLPVAAPQQQQQQQSAAALQDPCLPAGLNVSRPSGQQLVGAGNFSQCVRRLLPLLERERPCELAPCSLLGRHQPPIDFVKTEFYGFSEYWYCMNDVLGMGGQYDYLPYRAAAAKYCATDWDQLERRYRENKFPKADHHRMKRRAKRRLERTIRTLLKFKRFQCFKSAWILAVLHYGLRFPRSYRKFRSVSSIAGTEVQWTLGAILHRTRYFPLREVQRLELDRQRHRNRRSSSLSGTYQYLLLVLAVLLVLLSLCRMHRRLGLRRVQSVGYLT